MLSGSYSDFCIENMIVLGPRNKFWCPRIRRKASRPKPHGPLPFRTMICTSVALSATVRQAAGAPPSAANASQRRDQPGGAGGAGGGAGAGPGDGAGPGAGLGNSHSQLAVHAGPSHFCSTTLLL